MPGQAGHDVMAGLSGHLLFKQHRQELVKAAPPGLPLVCGSR